jgi:hypothetical protein
LSSIHKPVVSANGTNAEKRGEKSVIGMKRGKGCLDPGIEALDADDQALFLEKGFGSPSEITMRLHHRDPVRRAFQPR